VNRPEQGKGARDRTTARTLHLTEPVHGASRHIPEVLDFLPV
jgi:hypothetical protein